jgi:WD40 repeat protein
MLREDIESLEFAPPDSILIVGHRHTCLRNLYGAEHDRVFKEPDTAITCCDVAEAGEHFAVGCHDGSIRIRRIKPKSGVQQLLKPAFGPSEHELGMPIRTAVSLKRRLTVVGFRTGWVSLIDSTSGETVSMFRVGKSGITSLILDADESWLACAVGTKNDAGLVIYSASEFPGNRPQADTQSSASPKPIASVAVVGVRKLCLSDDGRYLFAGLLSGEIAVIDTDTWTVDDRWQGHDRGIYAIDTHGDLLVSGGSDGWVRCWKAGTRELVCEWEAHSLRISDLKIRPRDLRIYTASFDETTAVWNLDGKLQFRLNGHSGAVRSLDVAPDGETLATASDDFTIRLWDAITGDGQLILRQHTDVVRHVLFDDDKLISTSQDGTIRVWGKAPASSTDAPAAGTVAIE